MEGSKVEQNIDCLSFLIPFSHTNNFHNVSTRIITMQSVINKLTGGSSLPTARLGKNGPEVNRIGYGAMGLSAFYGEKKPDEQRMAMLDKLYQDGELFWDSADMYADSEDLLGKVCHSSMHRTTRWNADSCPTVVQGQPRKT